MAAGRPVVAVNNGGPAETVVDGVTGLLCAAHPGGVCGRLGTTDRRPRDRRADGPGGPRSRGPRFSKAAFGARLERLVVEESRLHPAPGT